MRRIFTWHTERYHLTEDCTKYKDYTWLAKVWYSNFTNVPKELIQPIYQVRVDTWRSRVDHYFTQEQYDNFLADEQSKEWDWDLIRKINGVIVNIFDGGKLTEESETQP